MHTSVTIRAPLWSTKRVCAWPGEPKMSRVFHSHLFRGLELASAAVFIHKCGEEWTISGPTKRVKRPERVGKPFIGRALAMG